MKNRTRKLALLLCLALLFTAAIGTTVAFWITGTEPIVNRFVSGLDPDGDLVIQKNLVQPYGEDYAVPADIAFEFIIGLGDSYGEKTVATNRGDMTADETGALTVSLRPGFRFEVYDLTAGTEVTVTETEIEGDGFTVSDEAGAARSLVIERGVNTVTFTNEYAPALPEIAITGEKVLEGRDWQVGESFVFFLEEQVNKTWAPVEEVALTRLPEEIEDPENPGEMIPNPEYDPEYWLCAFAMADYAFDRPGTWNFRVSEIPGEDGDLRYDGDVHYITVCLEDEAMDGALDATITVDGQVSDGTAAHIVFTNIYKPAPSGTAEAEIRITKTMEDRSGRAQGPEGFVFLLEDEDGNVIKSGPTNPEGETVIKLSYPASDAGKFFVYTLREDDSAHTPGMDYDDKEIELVVAVVDNGDGTVSAVVFDKPAESEAEEPEASEAPAETEAPADDAAAEDAPAEPTPVGDAPAETEEAAGVIGAVADVLDGLKKAPVRRSDMAIGDILGAVSDALNEAEDEAEEPIAPEESAAPGEIAPEQTDAPETTAEPETTSEPEPTEAPEAEAVFEIPAGAGSVYEASFENIYDLSSASVAISGEKILDGRELEDGMFTFLMYPATVVNGKYTVDEDAEPYEAENDGGVFTFETLTYASVATEHFVVKEENGGKTIDGVTYDDGVFYVTVTVSDDGTGALAADVSVYDDSGAEADIVFRNEYKLRAIEISIPGRKTLDGKPLKGEMFRFELYPAEADFTVSGETPLDTALNDAAGEFAFDLSFEEPGEAYYVVREENGGEIISGVSYDDTAYGIAVSVTDNGDGTMSAEKTITALGGEKTNRLAFENVFAGDTSLLVTIRKTVTLAGSESIGPEGFRFELTDQADPEHPAIYTMEEDGEVSFRLSYTQDDIGSTFLYTLKEINDGTPGVIYDKTVFDLTVQVVEKEDGTIAALVNGEETDAFTAAFENRYDVTVTPEPPVTPEPSVSPEPSATPTPTATSTPSDMPQTGDQNPILLYVVILLVLAAALVIVLLTARKGKKRR